MTDEPLDTLSILGIECFAHHGVFDHVRHHHALWPHGFHQVAGKTAMATCKFEQALRLEQRIVHLLQQQHQLGHRAPAIGQIVTDRVKA